MRTLNATPPNLALFPTRHFGAKTRMLDRILPLIPHDTETFFEPFGGTGVVSWAVKHRGTRIVINDIMRATSLRHKAYVVNNSTLLDAQDISALTTKRGAQDIFHERYVGIVGKQNAEFLDDLIVNIRDCDDGIKRDIATIVPCLTAILKLQFNCIRFTPYGGLTGGQHLHGIDMRNEFEKFAATRLPLLVRDNGKQNEAHQTDALDLIGKVPCDCMYVDSPYISNGGLYESQNAIWDDWVRFLQGKGDEVLNTYDKRADLPEYTAFHRRDSARVGFCDIFDQAKNIPTVIVSYNTTSGIKPTELVRIAKCFGRTVSITEVPYQLPVTVEGKDNRTTEVLIVATTHGINRPSGSEVGRVSAPSPVKPITATPSETLEQIAVRNSARRKKRQKATAEVFTPPALVNEMLDKYLEFEPNFYKDPTKTVCDPCCGNGNILVEVLKRKLANGNESIQALSTIYGVDIMADNIEECRQRLLQVVRDAGNQVTESHIAAVKRNIKWLDTKIYPRGALDFDFESDSQEAA